MAQHWRLVDGSSGVIDRATDTVACPCDSWPVHSQSELLALLQNIPPGGLRAMSLHSERFSVGFGFGGDFSYVEASSRQPPYHAKSYFRPILPEDCQSGLDTAFMLWQDDLLEFASDQLITWRQALDIILWILRHDELPAWDEQAGCRLATDTSPRAGEEAPF